MAESGFKYIGTKNGISTIFDDAELSGADAGSIGSALNSDNTAYAGSVGSGFGLGSLSGSQLGGYAQIGGLALGAYDDLFGTGGKTKKQQLSNLKKSGVLLDQQIANNTQSMADKKAFNQGMAEASAKAMGLGKVGLYDNTKVV